MIVSNTIAQLRMEYEERIRKLRHPFRNADNQDWDQLFRMIPDSGYGKFWKAVMTETRQALNAEQTNEMLDSVTADFHMPGCTCKRCLMDQIEHLEKENKRLVMESKKND